MNLEPRIHKLIAGDRAGQVFCLALDNRGFPSRGGAGWMRDRLRFLLIVASAPLRPRYRGGGDPPRGIVAYDPAASEASTRNYRSYYVNHHFGDEPAFLWRMTTPRARGLRVHMRAASWYWRWLGVALLSLADTSPRRYEWWASVMLDVRAYLRALDGVDRVYVFAMYDRRSYALASYLDAHTGVEVIPVFQNIPLYRNCRFFHMEIPVIVTSRVNLHEIEYFAGKGEFLASEVRYHGQEFLLDTVEVADRTATVDIGYFSSGEWARREGLYQVRDPEVVRSGVLRGTPYDLKATEIIDALAEYAHRTERRLRIYPHPFERVLMREHGVKPPYAHLDDGSLVTVDTGEDPNSRSKVFEPRVAVSLQSSFIWERLDLGLNDSFIYEFEDASLNPFLREALGPYSHNVFLSTDELFRLVDASLVEDR